MLPQIGGKTGATFATRTSQVEKWRVSQRGAAMKGPNMDRFAIRGERQRRKRRRRRRRRIGKCRKWKRRTRLNGGPMPSLLRAIGHNGWELFLFSHAARRREAPECTSALAAAVPVVAHSARTYRQLCTSMMGLSRSQVRARAATVRSGHTDAGCQSARIIRAAN